MKQKHTGGVLDGSRADVGHIGAGIGLGDGKADELLALKSKATRGGAPASLSFQPSRAAADRCQSAESAVAEWRASAP